MKGNARSLSSAAYGVESRSQVRKIVVVLPTVLSDDAVGNATVSMIGGLSKIDGAQVTLLALSNDRTDAPFVSVQSLGDMLMKREYLEADVIIYVFAIFSDLFQAILIGNGKAAQVVRFHNVTPKNFVEESDRDVIERSVDQIQNFRNVDEIWADSQENVDELVRQGIDAQQIRHVPLTVNGRFIGRLADKPVDILRFLYVGRFVPSKGIEDLIEACAIMKTQSGGPFQVRLMGSTRHSTEAYMNNLSTLIAKRALQGVVSIEGGVSRAVLSEAYGAAHVVTTASKHEGFCVPIIEGLASGCIPVTYANSNLKHISGGLGRLTDQDSPAALAKALMEIAKALREPRPWLDLECGPKRLDEFDAAAAEYVQGFSEEICTQRLVSGVERLLAKLAAKYR